MRQLEMRKKIRQQRDNVLMELLDTERQYCHHLQLTAQVFRLQDTEYLKQKGIDSTTLFGNLLEVIELSQRFINELNECENGESSSDAESASIGNCFIRAESEFRRVYGHYCTNYDDAQTCLEKYESMPEVSKVLMDGVLMLREEVVCFNMGSIIIKPVQRILKYPLLLNELVKNTESDHADREMLTKATLLMNDVASYINESKRKKDIVLKYRDSASNEKLSNWIGKLNMHAISKKSNRISMLLKTTMGLAPATRDSAFEEVESRFNELVQLIQTTLRDITIVSEQLKATSQTQFNVSEAVASFYGESSRVPVIDNFRTAQRIIFTQHWSAFEAYVIQHVRNPLTALCEACHGPERLVLKRRDKLLDVNIASEKLSKNKDPTLRHTLEEEENLARSNYAALNSQLLEELPIITDHGYSIYHRCLSSFLHARKLLVGRTTKELLDLNEMPEIACLKGNIDEDFHTAYSTALERFSSISFISKPFRYTRGEASSSPSTTPPRKSSVNKPSHSPLADGLVVQSRETINLLRSKYSADLLFMVMGRCEIKEPLDLAANSGLIVGVMKKEDPMGNTGRWFVDAGEIRGFLPAKYLNPLRQFPAAAAVLPTAPMPPTTASDIARHALQPDVNSGIRRPASASVPEASIRNSLPSFKEAQMMTADESANSNNPSALYDLPPSYEEAQGLTSPHRYCEIDDILDSSGDADREGASNNESFETVESPIYVEIEDLATPETKQHTQPTPQQSSNNVYKVEFAFEKRSPLEIDLRAGEFVTVLADHDEAGNAEWWLVENDSAAQGYAPAAYLSQLLVPNDSNHLFP